jgi:hypothetical protein
MSAELTDEQEKLFQFLRQMQHDKRLFDRADAISATGYSINSIRPYLTKHLIGRCVTRVRRGVFKARGMSRMKRSTFQRIVTQNKVPRGVKDWTAAVRESAALGARRGYPVVPLLRELTRKYSRKIKLKA